MAITQERMEAILDAVKEYEELFSTLETFHKKILRGNLTEDAGLHLILNFIQDSRISATSIAAVAAERERLKIHGVKNAYARRWRKKQKNPLNLDEALGEKMAEDFNPADDF